MSMLYIGIGTVVASTVVSVAGQQKAKKAAREDAEFEAGQLESRARLARASGQRSAAEERRQARLIESALQARAGGGGLDPTVANLQSDIAGEGEYRALAALFEAEESAGGMESSAGASRRTGRARGTAANYQMAGTVLNAASSIAGRYSDSKKPPAKAA